MVQYTLWDKTVDIDIPADVFPTDEEIKAMEANLATGEHGWFTSQTGAQLHYRKFMPPTQTPKGVVVYTHGILAHTGIAFILNDGRKISAALLTSSLTQAGYAVYGLDLLGHGYSEGIRWYVPNWEIHRDDLDVFCQFATSQHSCLPLMLYGESYGATLVLHLARKWQNDNSAPPGFCGIVILAPFIMGYMPPWPVVFVLRRLIAPRFPTWTPFFMPNPVSADKIWRDDEVRDLHTSPRWFEMQLEGAGRTFRLGTAVSLLNASEAVRESAIPGLTVPFCVIHGEKDIPVPIQGTEYLLEHASTREEDRAVYRIEDAFHDLLGDPLAEEAICYVLKFLDGQVEKFMNTSK